jgi:hypothetical protein
VATEDEKAARPHAHFDEPMAVVDDDALTKSQKGEALDALEQDARQMAAATSEGMGGGEGGGLHKVLTAKAALSLPPIEHAYDMVLRDLQSRAAREPQGAARALLDRAVSALAAVAGLSPPAPGQAAAAAEEVAEELARERLDP